MSKLTLDIYAKDMKEVVKTYECESFEVSYGIIEDLLVAMDLTKVDVNNEIAVGMSVAKALYAIKPIIMQIFDGITEEEIRFTKPSDITIICIKAITDTLGAAFGDMGNLMRG
jgi:hypothetical protein